MWKVWYLFYIRWCNQRIRETGCESAPCQKEAESVFLSSCWSRWLCLSLSYCNCIQSREDRIAGRAKIVWCALILVPREEPDSLKGATALSHASDICRDTLHHHHISQLGRNLCVVCSITRHTGRHTVVRRSRKISVRSSININTSKPAQIFQMRPR